MVGAVSWYDQSHLINGNEIHPFVVIFVRPLKNGWFSLVKENLDIELANASHHPATQVADQATSQKDVKVVLPARWLVVDWSFDPQRDHCQGKLFTTFFFKTSKCEE